MISIDTLAWRFRQVLFVLVGVVLIPFGVWQLATGSASVLQALFALGFGLIALGMVFQRRLAAHPRAYAAFMAAAAGVFMFCLLAVIAGAFGKLSGTDQPLMWVGVALCPVAMAAWLRRCIRA